MSDDILSQMTPVIIEEPLAVGHDHEPRAANEEPRRNAFGVPLDPELAAELAADDSFGADPIRGAPVGTVTPSEGGGKHEVMLVGGTEEMRTGIVDALKTIYDPEIPVNIYELGLVYNIVVDDASNAAIRMTLTSPACPVAGTLPPEVEQKVASVPGVTSAKVDIVWEPPWTPDKMSDEAKLQLNMY
jgi:FeS assembly SUF system protein